MSIILGLFFDAAIIGLVIAVMEQGEFPGWGPTIGIVFAIGLTASGIGHFLPGYASLLALLPAAAVGAFMISWLCEMTMRRAAIAASVYLGIRFVLSFLVMLLVS